MSRQCRILVIDDDPNLCRTLTLMLEHAGHAVTVASGRQEDCGCLPKEGYDLILLDVAALGRNGYALLAQLRQDCPEVSVLVLIGQDESGLDMELRQRGANAIVYKPVDSEYLLAQVTAVLEARCLPNHTAN